MTKEHIKMLLENLSVRLEEKSVKKMTVRERIIEIRKNIIKNPSI